MRVVDPHRAPLPKGDEAQLLAEPRHQVKPRGDVVAKLLVVGGRALHDDRRGDVHVGSLALHVQKRRVEPGEAILAHEGIFSHREQA